VWNLRPCAALTGQQLQPLPAYLLKRCDCNAAEVYRVSELPEFGGQEAPQRVVVRYAGESCPGQGSCVIGKSGGAEASENAEGKIEASDDDPCGKAHGAGWDTEIGDEPERAGGKGGGDARNQKLEIGLDETIQKKMRNDEIIRAAGREIESADVASVEAASSVWNLRFATLAQQVEHRGAGVYGLGMEMGICSDKLSEETAVSISEDQGASRVEEPREIVEAAVLQGPAESKVFEPAIGPRYKVEVGPVRSHRASIEMVLG